MQITTVYLKCRIREQLSKDLYEKWLKETPEEFQRSDTSSRLNKLTNELNTIIEQFVSSKLNIYRYLCLFIVGSFYIGYNSWILLLFIYISAFSLTFFNHFFKKQLENNQKKVLQEQKNWIQVLKEFCSIFLTVKLYNLGGKYSDRLCKQNVLLNQQIRKSEIFKKGILVINDLGINVTFFGEALIGFYLMQNNLLSIGILMSIIQASNMVINPIGWYMEMYNNVQSSKVIVDEYLSDIAQRKAEKTQLKDSIHTFSVNDLVFKRRDKIIFNHFSFKFHEGQKYLIVGKSGSGKSTLLELLSGIIEQNNVFVNSVPVKSIDSKSIFSQVTYLRQFGDLIPGTLEENITLWEDPKGEKLKNVLQLSHLETLENRLKEPVNSDILQISGGELQRISLARGLYHLNKWLFLDEAFSALDEQTARSIEKEILGNKDLSVISISHKIFEENINLYDTVIEFTGMEINEYTSNEYLQKRRIDSEKN